ncbi:hypothetical protein FACS1894164_14940 [Spirochaetia bacterium]|nr:hypothetical protein FACS1894164_14940 [Spirochaetia bacterium]
MAIFGAKKVVLPESDNRGDKRKLARYSSIASVQIRDFEGTAIIKDMNDTGCCIESLTYIAVNLEEEYYITIIPEVTANIPEFDLIMKVKWTKSTETCFETGLSVIENPDPQVHSTYVNYLKWRENAYKLR